MNQINDILMGLIHFAGFLTMAAAAVMVILAIIDRIKRGW